MAQHGSDDDRFGNRGRDRDDRGHYGAYRGEGRDRSGGGGDRGFFDRAGDEVRSWFGDDDSQRRRERDERHREEEHRMRGERDTDPRSAGAGSMGGGWGNQRGESWNRDRPGERDSSGNDRIGAGISGFGGYADPRGGFDRQDRGAIRSRSRAASGPVGDYGRAGDHDPRYSQWRQRQIEELDRDYDEYRREHQSKFEQEFGGWREKRQSQRQMLAGVREHMEVIGSDSAHIGTVDKVRGDRIILTKSDPNAGGMHHSVPCGWVERVEDNVVLNRKAEDAIKAWRNDDNGRALFERDNQGSEGPHALDRSFSGTYGGRNDD